VCSDITALLFSPWKITTAWLDIGYITADFGGILLLIALVLAGIGIRKACSGRGAGLLNTSSALAAG
jgi:hypothetical protein